MVDSLSGFSSTTFCHNRSQLHLLDGVRSKVRFDSSKVNDLKANLMQVKVRVDDDEVAVANKVQLNGLLSGESCYRGRALAFTCPGYADAGVLQYALAAAMPNF